MFFYIILCICFVLLVALIVVDILTLKKKGSINNDTKS